MNNKTNQHRRREGIQHQGQAKNNDKLSLGIRFLQDGKCNDAIPLFKSLLKVDAKNAEIPYLLGLCHLQLKDFKRAVNFISKAIKLDDTRAEMHSNLGIAYRHLNDYASAEKSFEKGLSLDGDFSACRYNAAINFKDLKQYDRAVSALEIEIKKQPNNAQLHFTLGNVYHESERFDQAVSCFRKATEIKPNYKEAWVNLGNNCKLERQYQDALEAYDKALSLDADNHAVAVNKGMLLLQDQQYKAGWPLYERRTELVDFQDDTLRKISSPLWKGESIKDKTILVYAEQGLGDTVQFARYASWVKTLGAKVVLYVDKPLKGLLSGLKGVDETIGREEAIPKHDYRISVMSLPSVYYTLDAEMQFETPYLKPKEEFVSKWQGRFKECDKLKVGIVWQGNPDYIWDKYRSIPLEECIPLIENEHFQIYSLQVGDPKKQLQMLLKQRPEFKEKIIDIGELILKEGASFDDTAAIVQSLDVMVAADTSMTHVAGALGIPVKTALNVVPDWRWPHGIDRPDYYDDIKVYRQDTRNDWGPVFQSINEDLELLYSKLYSDC